MEIAKFKSHLSITLEQIYVYVQPAGKTFTRFRTIVVKGFQDLRCKSRELREKLRVWWQEAVVFALPKLTYLRSQAFVAGKWAAGSLQKSWHTLTVVRAGATNTLQKARSASGKNLQKLRTSSYGAVVVANGKVIQLGLQVSTASKQLAIRFQKAQTAIVSFGKSVADRRRQLRLQAAAATKQLAGPFQKAQTAIAGFGKSVADRPRQLRLQAAAATKRLAGPFQKAQTAIVGFGKSVADQPRRLREARRAKEDQVRELLEDSPDAVVLTDVKNRLVAANPNALNLFGISEVNQKNFTIDAFLTQNPFPELEGNGSTSRREAERRSQCKIRRLDGGLQVAECVFVAHALPHRHLYKFLNACPYKIAPLGFTVRNAARSTSRAVESQPNSDQKATKPIHKLPRHGVRPVI